MIKFDFKPKEIEDLEKKVYDDAIMIMALCNSRNEKITSKMALLLSIWESLKTDNKQKNINLYVGLINNGLTDFQIKDFIKRINQKYESQLKDKFKN